MGRYLMEMRYLTYFVRFSDSRKARSMVKYGQIRFIVKECFYEYRYTK
jgi:hypothetical protein